MNHWRSLALFFILLCAFNPVQAQTSIPDEPDTEAFITDTFHLQDQYSGVLCVSQDQSACPAQFDAVVPCLLASCNHPSQTYPVTETYETLQEAADSAQPGNLIIIMPGHYAGIDVEETGGEDGAYIHFLGMGELGDVVVDRTADPDEDWLRHEFYFVNVHHYIIQNITFTGAPNGAGIFFTGYFSDTGAFSHHMIVMNVYSHDNYKWGMHTTSTNDILVQDSVFTNSEDEHGMYISGSGDGVVIRRNIFQGNNAAGVQVNADPQTAMSEVFYWLENSTGDTCDLSEDDIFETTTWDEVKACYDQQGLPDLGANFEDGISEHLIIEQNIITGNGAAGGAGINLASVRHSIVRNNLVYGNGAAGIACWDNAYAEEKGLDESNFGCHDVQIVNNTLVDETGGRGSLIFTHDAQDLQVYNNIIVRDRFDAYEVSGNSGAGLQSNHNYLSAQSIEDSPGFDGDADSISGFSVAEALAQFVNPNFEAWVLPNGDGYTLNPARPDYHPHPDSSIAVAGDASTAPEFDLFGSPRTSEIGALVAADS